jgi:TPR repeat protein
MNQTIKTNLFRALLAVVFIGFCATARADLESAKQAYRNQDYTAAFNEFKSLANAGDRVAQFYVGLMYDNSEGMPQDYNQMFSRVDQAMSWYRKSAEQGFAPAQANLAVMLETGGRIERNYKEAAAWYRKAAAQGNVAAQFNLGLIYYVGRGDDIAQDYKEALTWFRKAAEQGDAAAQIAYGRMFEYGQGTGIDYVQAYKWYLLADATGNESAPAAKASAEAKMTPEQIAEAVALVKKPPTKHAQQ